MGVDGMSTERRLFERLSARFPTRFRDSSPDFGVDVFLRDVSASGARVTTRERLFLDDVVAMDVKVPDGRDPVPLNGRVRWIRQVAPRSYDVGIEFHKVNFLRLHRLMKYALTPVAG